MSTESENYLRQLEISLCISPYRTSVAVTASEMPNAVSRLMMIVFSD